MTCAQRAPGASDLTPSRSLRSCAHLHLLQAACEGKRACLLLTHGS